MDEINRQLKLINDEDIVWIIYFFIVFFAIFTNSLEKKYLFTKDKKILKTAKNINTISLIVASLIYLYFFYNTIKAYMSAKNYRDHKISFERIIVNGLFLVAGFISIYVDYDDNTTNPDLAIF